MTRKFDHLVLCAADLDRAQAFYRAIGFTLTPRALHPFGTANSLVQLQGNFLEILSVADPALIPAAEPGRFSFARYNQAFLNKQEGFSMLVLASSDAAADAAAFKASGLNAYDVFNFGRDATLPDGSKARVDFSLAFVTEPSMPEAVFFTCQQHAPQYFWRPEYQRHANGARRVTEVVMSARRPGDYKDFFERLMKGPVRTSSSGIALGDGRETLTMLDRTAAAARYPGALRPATGDSPRLEAYVIEVTVLSAVGNILGKAGLPFAAAPDSLVLPASAAFGSVIEFRGAL